MFHHMIAQTIEYKNVLIVLTLPHFASGIGCELFIRHNESPYLFSFVFPSNSPKKLLFRFLILFAEVVKPVLH